MLIEPPFYRLYHDQFCLVKYPLALGYLAGSAIKKTDWSVQAYNADFNTEKKNFVPENDYVTGEGFDRYLSSLKDYSLPIWKEVRKSISSHSKTFVPFIVECAPPTKILISGLIFFAIFAMTVADVKF